MNADEIVKRFAKATGISYQDERLILRILTDEEAKVNEELTELRKDKARLDWLSTPSAETLGALANGIDDIREAIDAARAKLK